MIRTDRLHRILYSTDASAYRELPKGVIVPKSVEEVRQIIRQLGEKGGSLIPRGAGTSLAGQVVGAGIVADVSQYWNKILEVNVEERWVRLQPGVVRDELNQYLKPYGLFFAPETSTSNRCTLGGMVGNNACGSHSIVYGSTRDHLLEAKVLLSDGSEALFGPLDRETLSEKTKAPGVEGNIYRYVEQLIKDEQLKQEIVREYPHPALRRRNTGYALDELLGLCTNASAVEPGSQNYVNVCKLLAGSEGTLAFITELKLSLEPLPPAYKGVLCVHCAQLEDVFEANLVILKEQPCAVELMDRNILERAADNPTQQKNRFFVQGDPAAILVAEFACATEAQLRERIDATEGALGAAGFGYAYIRVFGADIEKVWSLRKAGLGLLTNIPGSRKPVSVIEDTAVAPELLPAYMRDFAALMEKHGLSCVYHAHIGSGELHLRPVLDLKKSEDRKLFSTVAQETALLVKKYRGSLSGEHGDGRLRGAYIPLMYSPLIISTFYKLKEVFDPMRIFNPGKILDAPPVDEMLRYEADAPELALKTCFDFSVQQGLLSAIEQCNGSGDCRKSRWFEGGMCPSFRASGEEMHTTRARANLLRELLSYPYTANRFRQPELAEILDACLSCKACKSECPSNVDMTRIKAEVMQAMYDTGGIPFRTWLVSVFDRVQQMGAVWPRLYNFMASNRYTSGLIKRCVGFAPERPLPLIASKSLKKWFAGYRQQVFGAPGNDAGAADKKVWLFADEFTNRNDVHAGQCAVMLLNRLGYRVELPEHTESGRAAFSKGRLSRAKKLAQKNVALLEPLVSEEQPMIGIEPSCLLSFRDEYPDLLGAPAQALAQNCLLIDEFLIRELETGRLTLPPPVSGNGDAPPEGRLILHGHCHQMALAKIETVEKMLRVFLPGVRVERTPEGCCGMAGAFGYEKKHYSLSQKIGEQRLFPLVNGSTRDTLIVAPGTSCRQQIAQATGRKVLHPVEAVWAAMNDPESVPAGFPR